MLELFRNLLGASGNSSTADDTSVENATAALLTKMAGADFEVKDSERQALRSGVRKLLDLSDQEAEDLLRVGEAQAAESVSLYDFTRVLQRNLGPEEKRRVVRLLWTIAFADGEIDAQEEFLVRKVSRLLHLPQADFIAAKQAARKEWQAANE